jgi:hypothetical protein
VEDAISVALRALEISEEVEPPPKNMIMRILKGYKFVVFDLFHSSYNLATAHLLEQNNLEVKMVHIRRVNIVTAPASSALRAKVNDEVAEAHNTNGWDVEAPFFEDITAPPVPHYFLAI